MTNRFLPLLAALPLAAYGVAAIVAESSDWSALVAVAALVTALPFLTPLWPGARVPLALPAVALIVVIGIDGFLSGHDPAGAAADVSVGVLVGLPLWATGVLSGVIERPGLAFAALAELLVDVVFARATQVSLVAPTGTAGYTAAWLLTLNRQVSGVAQAIATNGLGSPILFPTAYIVDPLLILTGVIALAGVLLPLFPPLASGRLPPAPVPRRDLAPPVRLVAPPVLNPPDTFPTEPRPSPGPTLAPVVGAVVAVAGFEYFGAVAPRLSFLAVTVTTAVALAVLVVLGRWGVPRPAPRLRPRRVP